jgi:signal transduction histidine kinase/CheY-like chemotaxis protein
VYVAAALDAAEVRASWLRRIGVLAAFAVPATGVLTWMTRVALVRTRREVAAAERLDDETALRQRMEVALLQSQKLEALGRLTGGVAHDFNNLLMVITSNLFVHRRKHPEAADSAQLVAIERAVAAGTKLTRQLLSFTRRQALVPERVDLRRRLPALLELIGPVLGKSIELHSRVDDDIASIEVDPAELELALINLAVNAKDAMPSGGTLEVLAHNGDAATVVIEVADSGSGIAPGIAARVFEPFFTTKPVGQGTGLGLSQVQALCQSSGGSARIEPRPGGGTRVLLTFPALSTDARPAVGPIVRANRQRVECDLLLVEDNDAVATASHAMLESLGCRVERVADGPSALARLARPDARFGLVLSDIEMPGPFDGIALADRIAAQYPRLPVLLMTGYAERLQEAVRRRFEVLPKPVPPNVLADAIARAMG